MEIMNSEFKFSETDAGFRIDIKGNKETIRQMLNCFGFCDSYKAGAPFSRNFCFDSDFWSRFGGWCGSWEKAKGKC